MLKIPKLTNVASASAIAPTRISFLRSINPPI
jgi:hypothetical protein